MRAMAAATIPLVALCAGCFTPGGWCFKDGGTGLVDCLKPSPRLAVPVSAPAHRPPELTVADWPPAPRKDRSSREPERRSTSYGGGYPCPPAPQVVRRSPTPPAYSGSGTGVSFSGSWGLGPFGLGGWQVRDRRGLPGVTPGGGRPTSMAPRPPAGWSVRTGTGASRAGAGAATGRR